MSELFCQQYKSTLLNSPSFTKTLHKYTDRRPESLKRTRLQTNVTSAMTGGERQYVDSSNRRTDGRTDRTGLVVGGHMQWQGHTYRGGSAGYAHKPNRN